MIYCFVEGVCRYFVKDFTTKEFQISASGGFSDLKPEIRKRRTFFNILSFRFQISDPGLSHLESEIGNQNCRVLKLADKPSGLGGGGYGIKH
jgi:hypothetical protein